MKIDMTGFITFNSKDLSMIKQIAGDEYVNRNTIDADLHLAQSYLVAVVQYLVSQGLLKNIEYNFEK